MWLTMVGRGTRNMGTGFLGLNDNLYEVIIKNVQSYANFIQLFITS